MTNVYLLRSKMFRNNIPLPTQCDTFSKRIEFEQNMIFFAERLAYWSILDQENDMPDTILRPTKVIIKIKGGSYIYNQRPVPMKAMDVIEKYDTYQKNGRTFEIKF